MLIQAVGAAGQVPEHMLKCVCPSLGSSSCSLRWLCKVKAPRDSAAEGGLVRGVEMEDFFN